MRRFPNGIGIHPEDISRYDLPTDRDREIVVQFGRYFGGKMSVREKLAFTGMDGGNPGDIERLARIREIVAGGCTLTELRDAAGLSLSRAAWLAGLAMDRLRDLEGGAEATDEERRKLCRAYAVDGWTALKVSP